MKPSLVQSTESTLQVDEFAATTEAALTAVSTSVDDSSDDSSNDSVDGDDSGDDDSATDAPDGIIFGETTVFIEGRSTQVRTESTTLGVLSAEANLFSARQVDSSVSISITHAGSITGAIGAVGDDGSLLPTQANLAVGKLEGQISQLDIQTALSANSSLVLLSLTREEILQVIESGISASGGDTLSDRFPQLSGIAFSYDVNLPPGQRVRSLAVTDDEGNIADVIVRDGVFQSSSSQTYRIVTTDVLASGGEGYSFSDTALSSRLDLTDVDVTIENNVATFAEFGSQQAAFAEYLSANFSSVPFSVAETSVEQDVVIQNLSFRSDTVVDINVNTFKVAGTAKRDRLVAGNLGDILRGFGGKDILKGLNGDDRLFGGGGKDKILCGFGDDRAFGNQGKDILIGGKGNDRLNGGLGRDRLNGGIGDDWLFGGKGDDVLRAGQGNDQLFGGKGNDVLVAQIGDTLLDGGVGEDLLIGGRGITTFLVASRNAGVKTISNFSATQGDILKFESYQRSELTITQSGNNTIVTSDNVTLAVLLNVRSTIVESSIVAEGESKAPKSPKDSDDLVILGFEYEPGTDVVTGQKEKYTQAVGIADDDDLAYLVVSDKKGKLDKTTRKDLEKGRTYFAGEVTVGDGFFADVEVAGKSFKKRTFVHLFEDEQAFLDDEKPLQIMGYNTSGKQPIQIGDTIGSVQVNGYLTAAGEGAISVA